MVICTAFLWGLGASSGAAFGWTVFLLLKYAGDRLIGKAEGMVGMEFNRKTLEALLRRNELTEEMVQVLNRIDDAVSQRVRLDGESSKPLGD